MPLITLADIRALKPISQNSNNSVEARYNSIIEDSEFHDVRPLLGTKLYQDLISNNAEANYVTLLTGGTYDHDNFQYTNPGLNRVLIEFAYARIMFFSESVFTPYGLVEKKYNDAESIGRARAKELYKAAQDVAMEYWIEVRNFLDRNTSEYQYWYDCDNKKRNNLGFKLKHHV